MFNKTDLKNNLINLKCREKDFVYVVLGTKIGTQNRTGFSNATLRSIRSYAAAVQMSIKNAQREAHSYYHVKTRLGFNLLYARKTQSEELWYDMIKTIYPIKHLACHEGIFTPTIKTKNFTLNNNNVRKTIQRTYSMSVKYFLWSLMNCCLSKSDTLYWEPF